MRRFGKSNSKASHFLFTILIVFSLSFGSIASNVTVLIPWRKIPIKVEYSLTDLGKSLIPLLHSIAEWGDFVVENHLKNKDHE
jgi:hypothetical protein